MYVLVEYQHGFSYSVGPNHNHNHRNMFLLRVGQNNEFRWCWSFFLPLLKPLAIDQSKHLLGCVVEMVIRSSGYFTPKVSNLFSFTSKIGEIIPNLTYLAFICRIPYPCTYVKHKSQPNVGKYTIRTWMVWDTYISIDWSNVSSIWFIGISKVQHHPRMG